MPSIDAATDAHIGTCKTLQDLRDELVALYVAQGIAPDAAMIIASIYSNCPLDAAAPDCEEAPVVSHAERL